MVELRRIPQHLIPPRYPNITHGDTQSIGQLHGRIREADGEVGVIVHPFYDPEGKYKLTQDYRDELINLVDTFVEEGIPIVIFEEKKQISMLHRRLPVYPKATFLVETIRDDPTPATEQFKDCLRLQEWDKDYAAYATDKLVRKAMAEGGVTHALISGRYLLQHKIESGRMLAFKETVQHLQTARQWIDRDLYPNACVGGVIKSLFRNNIEVDISRAVGPFPKDIFVEDKKN